MADNTVKNKKRRKKMRLSFEDLWAEEYFEMAYSCCDYEYWYFDELGGEEDGSACGPVC